MGRMSEEEEREPNLPSLPEGPKTTADMGLSILDLTHDKELRDWANVLVKTDCPINLQSLFLNCLNVALYLKRNGYPERAQVRLNRVATALQMRPSHEGKRIKQLLTPIELELHREIKKNEEKPKI